MSCLISFTLIVLTSIFLTVNSFSAIPALLWSPERSMSELPEVKGVDAIKSNDFLDGYLSPLMNNPSESAVVFLQDKLHINDFTRFGDVYSIDSDGGAFKYIKSLMEDHFSLELPQVSNPCEAVDKLKASFSGDIHTVKSAEEVEGLNLTKDKKVLLIVDLNPTSGHRDQEKAIQQNDATVGAISQHLQKHNIKYSALFTGQAASDDKVDGVESHSTRRLLAEPNNNGTFLNISGGEMFVFLKDVYIDLKINGKPFQINVTVEGDIASNSTRDNKTGQIELHFKNGKHYDDTYDVRILTEVKNLKDRWVMSRIYLYIRGGSTQSLTNVTLENVTLSPGDMDLTVPMLYSWHCTDMQLSLDTVHQKEYSEFKGSIIRLTGFQIQPFNIQKNRFFDAQDCVGYFTTAIWMFLFSSIFLISILVFGVLMVLSLSTMDKYDDPKGKTISIAQGTD